MKTRRLLLTLALISAVFTVVSGQREYRMDTRGSKMTVSGTSSIHEWEMDVRDPEGSAKFLWDSNRIQGISDLSIKVKPAKLDSGKKIMDDKTQDALKAGKYNTIEFKLLSVENLVSSDTEFHGTVVGNLSIAGQVNRVAIPFTGKLMNGYKVVVTGKKNILMSDFKIKPPVAMMGALETGDEVSIAFDVVWDLI